MTRTAISPRLAMRTLVSTPYGYWRAGSTCQNGARRRCRSALRRRPVGGRDRLHERRPAGRWPAQGEPEGVVLVADHQTAGRGRAGRTWTAPPGAALLCSILLRPPGGGRRSVHDGGGGGGPRGRRDGGRCLRSAEVAQRPRVAGRRVGAGPEAGRHPGRGRLAGVVGHLRRLADARAPRPGVVVVGIGINVHGLPDDLADLADLAVALDELTPSPPDREDLLVALLEALGARYEALVGRRPGRPAGRLAAPVRPPSAARCASTRRRRRGRHRGRHHRRGPPRRRRGSTATSGAGGRRRRPPAADPMICVP